jgi:hypothetical protein
MSDEFYFVDEMRFHKAQSIEWDIDSSRTMICHFRWRMFLDFDIHFRKYKRFWSLLKIDYNR